MTDQEAIETILDYKPIFGWREYCKAIDIAVSALKEREERQKGCECCGLIYSISTDYGIPKEIERRIDNKYCPMCGRKLGDEK